MPRTKSYKRWADSHPEKVLEMRRNYYHRHRDKINELRRAKTASLSPEERSRRTRVVLDWKLRNPERAKALEKKSREKSGNKERKRIANQKRNNKYRMSLIEYLGSRCVHCGYDVDWRAFQVDHINGDGFKDPNKGKSPRGYYEYIVSVGGEGYQLLCANCNQIKRYEMGENRRA